MGLINTEHQYRLVYTLIHRYITAGLNRLVSSNQKYLYYSLILNILFYKFPQEEM